MERLLSSPVLRTEPAKNLAAEVCPSQLARDCTQFRPLSVVLNVRPSAAVTVAVLSSVARIDVRGVGSGKGRRRHERPSVESSTAPSTPTRQHTDGEGDAPAVSVMEVRVSCGCQLDPPSVERSTPPGTSRHWIDGFDDTMTFPGAAALARANVRWAAVAAGGADDAGDTGDAAPPSGDATRASLLARSASESAFASSDADAFRSRCL